MIAFSERAEIPTAEERLRVERTRPFDYAGERAEAGAELRVIRRRDGSLYAEIKHADGSLNGFPGPAP